MKQPHIKLSRNDRRQFFTLRLGGGHPESLRQNRISEIRKRIRIDTDAILELLAHAHYRRYVGLGDLSHRLLEGWLKRAERWRWLTLGCSSLRTTMWFVREFGWS